MSPCTQGHRRSQTKGPASFGGSSIRENRAAVLPAPRQNGGVRGRRRINAEGFRWLEPNGPPRRKRRNRTSLWPSKIGTRPGDVIKDARLGNQSRCGHCIPTQSYKLAPRRSDSRLLTIQAVKTITKSAFNDLSLFFLRVHAICLTVCSLMSECFLFPFPLSRRSLDSVGDNLIVSFAAEGHAWCRNVSVIS